MSEVKRHWPEDVVGTGEQYVLAADFDATEPAQGQQVECEAVKVVGWLGGNGLHAEENMASGAPFPLMTVEQHERIVAAQQRTHVSRVPEGWRLVPVEPTPEMAAQTAYNGTHYSDPFDFEDFKKDYAAMLAASPAPPQQTEQQPIAHVSEETFSSDGTSDIITCNLPIGMALYADPIAQTAPAQPTQPALTVWEGAMPESNGKSNYTAVLMRKGGLLFDGISGGMTIARSEYPDRVRYEADCVRYLIGELQEEPCIIDYDADKHSGYSAPARPAVQENYPECDYCGVTPDYHPWHGSGMLNGVESRHIHACNACRSLLPASPAQSDVQRLREALEGMLEYFPEGASDGECFAVDAARDALAASTGQEQKEADHE